jgi:hypothetical protein
VIKVLPYTNGVDGISYYKTVTPNGEEDETYKAAGRLQDALNEVTIYEFHNIGDIGQVITASLFGFDPADTFTSEEVEYDDWYIDNVGREKNGYYITRHGSDSPVMISTDDNVWNNILFSKTMPLGDTKVFAVALERDYETAKKERLTKQLYTIETSSLYDARPLMLQVDEENTYVEVINTYVDAEGTESPQEGGGKVNVDAAGQTYVQTIGFKFKFPPEENPLNANCDAFKDYKSMSYSFVLRFGEDKYSIKASDVSLDSVSGTTYLTMKAKWPQDIGISADYTGGFDVVIFGKTRDNFVYKISNLKFVFNSFKDPGVIYDPTTKKGEGMEPNNKYVTRFNFIQYA